MSFADWTYLWPRGWRVTPRASSEVMKDTPKSRSLTLKGWSLWFTCRIWTIQWTIPIPFSTSKAVSNCRGRGSNVDNYRYHWPDCRRPSSAWRFSCNGSILPLLCVDRLINATEFLRVLLAVSDGETAASCVCPPTVDKVFCLVFQSLDRSVLFSLSANMPHLHASSEPSVNLSTHAISILHKAESPCWDH